MPAIAIVGIVLAGVFGTTAAVKTVQSGKIVTVSELPAPAQTAYQPIVVYDQICGGAVQDRCKEKRK